MAGGACRVSCVWCPPREVAQVVWKESAVRCAHAMHLTTPSTMVRGDAAPLSQREREREKQLEARAKAMEAKARADRIALREARERRQVRC